MFVKLEGRPPLQKREGLKIPLPSQAGDCPVTNVRPRSTCKSILVKSSSDVKHHYFHHYLWAGQGVSLSWGFFAQSPWHVTDRVSVDKTLHVSIWKALPVTGLQDTSIQTLPTGMGQGRREPAKMMSVSLGGSAETAQAFHLVVAWFRSSGSADHMWPVVARSPLWVLSTECWVQPAALLLLCWMDKVNIR